MFECGHLKKYMVDESGTTLVIHIPNRNYQDAIGMGKDRKKYDDSRNRKICLCRTHHTECHIIGEEAFEDKYKVYGIVTN